MCTIACAQAFYSADWTVRGFCEGVLIGLILFSNASWINKKQNEPEKAPSLVTVYALDLGTVFTSVEFLKESRGSAPVLGIAPNHLSKATLRPMGYYGESS